MSEAQEDIISDQPVNTVTPIAPVKETEQFDIEVTDEEQKAPELSEQEAKPFDPKTDRVEFTTPEQQAKFNDQYKQRAMADQRNAMLNDMLQTQQKRLEELENRFKNTDSAQAENMLLHRIKLARDSGDDAAEIAALSELTDFRVDKKLAERAKPAATQVNQMQEMQDTNYVANVMQEKDQSGNILRPYLYEGHPDFEQSVATLEQISQKYVGDPQSVPKSIAELDQLMRAKMTKPVPPSQPQTRAPNPMQGSNLTNAGKKTTIKMTRGELEIARKLGIDPKRYATSRDEINAKGKK